MAEPKKKMSRTRTGQRRAHQKLISIKLISCPQCQTKKPSHQVCTVCGVYKGNKVINLASKTIKTEENE